MSYIMTERDAIEMGKKYRGKLPIIEIHSIQPIGPGLLNRDFNDRQKVITVGGDVRARFSSASVLHGIRFEREGEYDVHTRMMPKVIKDHLKRLAEQEGTDQDTLKFEMDVVNQYFSKKSEKKKNTKDEDNDSVEPVNVTDILATSQIIDMDRYTLGAIIDAIKEEAKKGDRLTAAKAATAVKKVLEESRDSRPLSEVTAIFGRMATDQTFSTVYSPISMSHAFSIDKYAGDTDDRTAVDDYHDIAQFTPKDEDGVGKNSGAGFMDTRDIGFPTFYRYAAIEEVKLFENLCIGRSTDDIDEILEKTYKLTAELMQDLITAIPTACKTRCASYGIPEAVYIDKVAAGGFRTASTKFHKTVKNENDKQILDIGVERLQKFAWNCMHGPFNFRDITGQYWISEDFDTPDEMEVITCGDYDRIVRP